MCTDSRKSKMLGWDDKHQLALLGFTYYFTCTGLKNTPFVKLFVNCIFIFEFSTAYPCFPVELLPLA